MTGTCHGRLQNTQLLLPPTPPAHNSDADSRTEQSAHAMPIKDMGARGFYLPTYNMAYPMMLYTAFVNA